MKDFGAEAHSAVRAVAKEDRQLLYQMHMNGAHRGDAVVAGAYEDWVHRTVADLDRWASIHGTDSETLRRAIDDAGRWGPSHAAETLFTYVSFWQDKNDPGVRSRRFHATQTRRDHRYSLGRDLDTARFYLAIPVSNRMVDYTEYYRLSVDEWDSFSENSSVAKEFAESCRRREQDERLIHQPGADRGVPS